MNSRLDNELAIATARPSADAALRIPLATYRLQFSREFTFADAARLVPYLAALGISHVYCSPYFKARPGSRHGYDIIDHNAFNPEIGSAADFEQFVSVLKAHGMGQMLDLVPNHMGVLGADNGWWLDVLENGQSSAYAEYFDIEWNPVKEELRGKVLVPVLGAPYGQVLDSGQLVLVFTADRGEFGIMYFEHRFPVDPREYPRILVRIEDRLAAHLGVQNPDLLELQSLIAAFGHLPERNAATPENIAERHRDKEIHKRRLAELCARVAPIGRHIEDSVAEINGCRGDPASFDALHELIKAQAYRLSYWRVAADDINYRRFFDINDLAALRMERQSVFDATHRLALELVADGKVEALRIDHPDGLYDPCAYFQRLQVRGSCDPVPTDDAASGCAPQSIYLVGEKIVAGHERLPACWPIHGTTGYRFANLVNGLFVDAAAESRIDRTYSTFIGERLVFDEVVYLAKKLIMTMSLSSELTVLANLLSRIAQASRHTCDFTLNSLRSALLEIVACFPVYRTYITAMSVSADDRRFVDWAVALAKKKHRTEDTSIFDFVRQVLLTEIADGRSQSYRDAVTRFAMKFQQFTAPVMAKGMEDTGFYRYNRLVSLNEVGGDPRTFGISLAAFHRASEDRAQHWPHTMLATTTHDSKRSEDVRVRIDVISEMPAAWRLSLRHWSRVNRSKKRRLDDAPAPARNDEYLLYQTLLGVWPLGEIDTDGLAVLRERLQRYMLKAAREAKVHTSWVNPNPEYEEALSDFVAALLSAPEKNLFLADFIPAQQRVARIGLFNSLSQALIKLTSPGVPDIYQGNESWEFSLVDPDNRHTVDFARLQTMLHGLETPAASDDGTLAQQARQLVRSMEDGRIKLYLTSRALRLRRDDPCLFQTGAYLPLLAQGPQSDCVCAYARCLDQRIVIVVVPRLILRLAADETSGPLDASAWGETCIPMPTFCKGLDLVDVFTGVRHSARQREENGCLRLADLLRNFPVALLTAATCVRG